MQKLDKEKIKMHSRSSSYDFCNMEMHWEKIISSSFPKGDFPENGGGEFEYDKKENEDSNEMKIMNAFSLLRHRL